MCLCGVPAQGEHSEREVTTAKVQGRCVCKTVLFRSYLRIRKIHLDV
jgi:hypothetical protein